MKMISVLILGIIVPLAGIFACPGARIQINDDTILTGGGIVSLARDKTLSIADLEKKKMIGKALDITDKTGKITHKILVLGTHGDKDGVIFTSYLVKEIPAKEDLTEENLAKPPRVFSDRILMLRTNYLGDGVFAKDSSPQNVGTKKDSTFSQLETAGCN